MKILENERTVIESNNGEFLLTNFRLRQTLQVLGKAQIKSVFLENLESSSIKAKSNIVLLIVAAICLIGGIATGEESGILMGVILGIICLVIYFFTRKTVITFNAGKESINLNASGMALEKCQELLYEVEKCKNDRYMTGK